MFMSGSMWKKKVGGYVTRANASDVWCRGR